MTSTKTKTSKEKAKKIEEITTTTTTDSDVVVNSPSLINPTHINLNTPKSPAETIGFPSLSIPVPHSGGSSINGLISPDPQNPSLNKTTYPNHISVQQQLQSLSQMVYLIF